MRVLDWILQTMNEAAFNTRFLQTDKKDTHEAVPDPEGRSRKSADMMTVESVG